jgi:NAD(P)-dependent dehydrogenase (short-subunit alcohol dehydrogenase family)
MRLTGKVALITNASRYMGPALTEEFAREGATLAVHDGDAGGGAAAVRIAEAHGRMVAPFGGDLTRSPECDALVEQVVARFGRLDILVNNSVHPPTGSPTEAVTDEAWRAMMAHLLDEPFFMLRAALRVMRPAKQGKIINMTSATGISGLPRYAAYAAARAAVNNLTRSVGLEVARDGVQVNAIAQNFVENPTYYPPALVGDTETLARILRNVPAGRLARSEESARLAVYLASEDADFFVGQVIPFAGGSVT